MSEKKIIKKGDHRLIAKDLELYIINEKIGQGFPILLPNWVIIRNIISFFIEKIQKKMNFQEVITPILGIENLYEKSGHLKHYQDYMFPKISKNNENFYLKSMTCPHHCIIYNQKIRSYRELPLRLCENSILHRYEPSGSLKGLERIRCMELSDHHIFVSFEELKEEFKKNYEYISKILEKFEIKNYKLICSLHDSKKTNKYHLNKKIWKLSENILISSLNELNLKYFIKKDEAAFYGPKLDFEVEVISGKNITISTIQIDLILANSFDLNYIDKEGKKKKPVIIHQSPIGTYQRFISFLCEKNKGKLPFWISPIQVAILPLNEEKVIKNYCERIKKKLIIKKIRVNIISEKTIGYRIKEIYKKKIPYYFIVGKKEIEKKIIKLFNTRIKENIKELSEKDFFLLLFKENKIINNDW